MRTPGGSMTRIIVLSMFGYELRGWLVRHFNEHKKTYNHSMITPLTKINLISLIVQIGNPYN